jgi:hypothetical protein
MRSEAARRTRLLAAFLLAVALPRPASPAEVIEAILAVVQERPILLSEVRVVQEVRGLARDPALEALIDERLMFEQAARLPQSAVTEMEVDRGVKGLLASAPSLAGRVAESDLRRLVRRQAAILKFVEFRFRPQVRVAADLAAEERDAAVRRALDERIEAWVKELRAGADIRYPRDE